MKWARYGVYLNQRVDVIFVSTPVNLKKVKAELVKQGYHREITFKKYKTRTKYTQVRRK